jgi:hypothetical protein
MQLPAGLGQVVTVGTTVIELPGLTTVSVSLHAYNTLQPLNRSLPGQNIRGEGMHGRPVSVTLPTPVMIDSLVGKRETCRIQSVKVEPF